MTSSYKIVDGAPLSNSHTVVKYVGGSFIDTKAKSAKTRIKGSAFLSRPKKDNGSPSYNWLDFFEGAIEEQMTQIRNIDNLTLKSTAVFAELNVGDTRQKIQAIMSNIDIIHNPVAPPEVKNKDDSHCVMTNIPNRPEDGYEPTSLEQAVGRIISRNVIRTHPAQQPSLEKLFGQAKNGG